MFFTVWIYINHYINHPFIRNYFYLHITKQNCSVLLEFYKSLEIKGLNSNSNSECCYAKIARVIFLCTLGFSYYHHTIWPYLIWITTGSPQKQTKDKSKIWSCPSGEWQICTFMCLIEHSETWNVGYHTAFLSSTTPNQSLSHSKQIPYWIVL